MRLDEIELGTDIYWKGRDGDSGVDGRKEKARDGTPLIWEQSIGLQEFDLTGGSNYGTLTYAQIKAIMAMAIPGATYNLEYDSGTTPVRFRTWEQPIIEYEPIGDREVLLDTDICRNIKIKLMGA